MFRDVSLYTETVSSPAQAPRVVHQAIAAAYAGRGVAHLTLPQDVIAATRRKLRPERRDPEAAVPARRERRRHRRNRNDRIDLADHVVIMCGAGCHGAADELRALSDRLEAPLIHSVKGKDIMPYDDPHWMGGIGMIGTRAAYDAVMNCDLLLMVGTDYPYSEFLPDMTVVVQIDERPQALGRRTETALGVVGSARPTLQLLRDRVAAKSDRRFWDRVAKERRKWDDMLDKQADLARSTDRIHPQAVARMVSDLAAPEAVFVLDTGLNTLWSANWIRQSGSQRIVGSFNNAAVGTALGQANGIQALDRSRQVIALCGDGGFNMLMGEFLTAAQHELPVKVVIYNNSCFGLIPLEAEAAGLPRSARASSSPIRILSGSRRPAADAGSRPRNRASSRAQSAKRWPMTDRRSSMRSSPPTRCRTCRISTSPWLGASPWPRSGKRFSRRPAPNSSVTLASDWRKSMVLPSSLVEAWGLRRASAKAPR